MSKLIWMDIASIGGHESRGSADMEFWAEYRTDPWYGSHGDALLKQNILGFWDCLETMHGVSDDIWLRIAKENDEDVQQPRTTYIKKIS